MSGDERVRMCAACRKHVYNFTAMRTEEVRELVQKTEGRVCGRFFQRADGTVMTADCPVGLRKLRRTAAAAIALVLAMVLLPMLMVKSAPSPEGSAFSFARVEAFARGLPVIGALIERISPTPAPVMGEVTAVP